MEIFNNLKREGIRYFLLKGGNHKIGSFFLSSKFPSGKEKHRFPFLKSKEQILTLLTKQALRSFAFYVLAFAKLSAFLHN